MRKRAEGRAQEIRALVKVVHFVEYMYSVAPAEPILLVQGSPANGLPIRKLRPALGVESGARARKTCEEKLGTGTCGCRSLEDVAGEVVVRRGRGPG